MAPRFFVTLVGVGDEDMVLELLNTDRLRHQHVDGRHKGCEPKMFGYE